MLGYNSHAIPSSIYVPNGLARPLRAGPEETKAVRLNPSGSYHSLSTEVFLPNVVVSTISFLAFSTFFSHSTSLYTISSKILSISPAVVAEKLGYPPMFHVYQCAAFDFQGFCCSSGI